MPAQIPWYATFEGVPEVSKLLQLYRDWMQLPP